MIRLNRSVLQDKIYACWLGKSIGGTLGTPYEGQKKLLDISGFKSKPGQPLPNDDLDLQLIWLKAMKENGPQKLNERILGEYWQEYIPPYWNEYGICKSNMARGLVPPLSGEYENDWKHSNGAWIRTEVWATLNPGLVEDAIRYGYMDACVDHGMGEGTYAAIFVAALQSAAFVIEDMRTLIEIGLSKIPASCRCHQFISKVLSCYDEGMDWKEVREILTNMSLDDPELGWFQAPANVAYTMVGLLWGKGDFKKSLIIAVDCGDDTDCTGATAGATLGLIYGTKIIPEDWKAYIGDDLVTIAVNRGAAWDLPLSCTALTNDILALHPVTLRNKNVMITDEESSADEADIKGFYGEDFSKSLAARSAYGFDMDFIRAHVRVDYDRAPDMVPNGTLGVKLTITNKFVSQQHFCIRFYLPEGWSVSGRKDLAFGAKYDRTKSADYVLTAGDNVCGKNRVIIEVTCEGHSDTALVPLVILG